MLDFVLMIRPFSYAEQLYNDLQTQRPDILAQGRRVSRGYTADLELQFADPNSALGEFRVCAWNEQIDIHWGWDLEHMHYLGCAESENDMYKGLYNQAFEELIATWTGEMVFLFCSNKNSTYGLLNELDEMVRELMCPSEFDLREGLVADLPPQDLEYIPITWTRPYDTIAKKDCERIQEWRELKWFCKRPF